MKENKCNYKPADSLGISSEMDSMSEILSFLGNDFLDTEGYMSNNDGEIYDTGRDLTGGNHTGQDSYDTNDFIGGGKDNHQIEAGGNVFIL